MSRSTLYAGASFLTLCAAATAQPLNPQTATSIEATTAVQDPVITAPEDAFEDIVTVTASARKRGSVDTNIAPELTLDATDVQSYGASNLSELLEELLPATGSSRGREGGGRPVILLNGQRISSFREIRNYPTEALDRVEVLPEEVALRYGYPADQRVVNFVLKADYRGLSAETEFAVPTAGGRTQTELDLVRVMVDGDNRWNLELELNQTTPILESERDIALDGGATPFAPLGNVFAVGGGEIDPDLSTLAGETVTSAAANGALTPSLSDFVPGANAPITGDDRRFRSLTTEEESLSFSAGVTRPVTERIGLSVNAGVDASHTERLLGLPEYTLTVPGGSAFSPFDEDVLLYVQDDSNGAQKRQSDTLSGTIGFTGNAQLGLWRGTLTANGTLSETTTETDRTTDVAGVEAAIANGTLNPFGPLPEGLRITDETVSQNLNGDVAAVFAGPLHELPAGDVRTSLQIGASTSRLETEEETQGILTETTLSRDIVDAQASLDIPLFAADDDERFGRGTLNANLNFATEKLSDFGTLTTYGYGLNWEPIGWLTLIASMTEEDGAPSISQLGEAVQVTQNVRTFDFVNGETVNVTEISGGNPNLVADSRQVIKLGFTAKPFDETDVTLRVDYTDSVIDNPISSFPSATAEIQAAFPGRFTYDADGTLIAIDTRPINYEESTSRDLRTGLFFNKSFGGEENGERGGRGGGRRGGPPGMGGRRGPDGSTRLRLSLTHNWALEDKILIRDGVEELDLLGGSATGNSGGRSEHEVEFDMRLFRNGLGVATDLEWQSGTRVDGDGTPSTQLDFSDLTTFDVRLFANLGQQEKLVEKYPFFKETRLSFDFENVFDTRRDVRDGNGITPINFQDDLLDPVGRTIEIEFRKTF